MPRVSSPSHLSRKAEYAVRKQPRQERSQLTVEAILEAAYQLFHAKGFQATATQIAERAGVSVGSMYQYFPNKEAILQTLLERKLIAGYGEIVRRVIRGQEALPGADRLIGDFVHGVLGLYHQERLLLRLERDHVTNARPPMGDYLQVRDTVLALEAAIRALPGANTSRSAIVCMILVQTVDSLCRQFILQQTELLTESNLKREISDMLVGYLGRARPDHAA